MTKNFFLLMIILVCSGFHMQGQSIRYSAISYWNPEKGNPYLEVIAEIPYTDLQFYPVMAKPGVYESFVNISVQIESQDLLLQSETVGLRTGELQDTMGRKVLWFSRRYALDSIHDTIASTLLITGQGLEYIQTSESIPVAQEHLFLSSPLFTTPFNQDGTPAVVTRGNTFFAPDFSYFMQPGDNSLEIYTELTKPKGKQAVIFLKIKQQNSNTVKYETAMKLGEEPFQPVATQLDLTELESGNFYLELQLYVQGIKEPIITTTAFQRLNLDKISDPSSISDDELSNSFVSGIDSASLLELLKGLRVIGSKAQVAQIENAISFHEVPLMKRVILNYFRNISGVKAEFGFEKFVEAMAYVNDQYSDFNRKGYESDRGRVYLQYGPPTDITESQFDSDVLPYEIWQYNETFFNETNIIFVFVNEDGASNRFRLIHSNATGEIRNSSWKSVITRGFQGNIDGSGARGADDFGGSGLDNF